MNVRSCEFRHGKTVGLGWVRVEFGLGQSDCWSKHVILSGLKMDSGQSSCGSGQVDPYFSHEFFYLLRKQHVFVIWKVMQ